MRNWQCSEYKIIKTDIPRIKNCLPTPCTKHCKEKFRYSKYNILIEKIQYHFADSNIVPPSMNEYKSS